MRLICKIDDRKRTLDDSSNEKLAREGFAKEIVSSESGSSVCGAVLYRKDALAVLKRQVSMRSSEDVFYSW